MGDRRGAAENKGDSPAYKNLKPGDWIAETETKHPFWAGRLICPDCGAEVLQRPARVKE